MNCSQPARIGTQVRFQTSRCTVFALAMSLSVGLAICLIVNGQVDAKDWARFRGPNGAGVSKPAAPVTWSPTKNLKWKTSLPGAGVSSPVVVGDVTKTHVNWNSPDASGYASPVVANDTMFLFSRGFVTRLDAKTGEQIKKERLPNATAVPARGQSGGRGGFGGMSSDYSSPVIAGDKLYYVRKSGETLVFTADAEFEKVAANRVTDENEEFSATPAICDGQIILRSNKSLYCVEEK